MSLPFISVFLWKDDDLGGEKRESNSITNQRALLKEYLKKHEEFAGCTVIEKCEM